MPMQRLLPVWHTESANRTHLMLNIEQRLRDREQGIENLKSIDVEQAAIEMVAMATHDGVFTQADQARHARLNRNFDELAKAIPAKNHTEPRQLHRINVEDVPNAAGPAATRGHRGATVRNLRTATGNQTVSVQNRSGSPAHASAVPEARAPADDNAAIAPGKRRLQPIELPPGVTAMLKAGRGRITAPCGYVPGYAPVWMNSTAPQRDL